jgi:hypothetical protein
MVLLLVGLVITAIGAGVAAKAVMVTDEQANELGATKWDSNTALIESIKDQSRSARNGLILIVIGTVFQIVGTAAPLIMKG